MANDGKYWDVSCNPLRTKSGGYHCTKTSPACENCWAEAINMRFGDGKRYDAAPSEIVFDDRPFLKLARMKKPQKVFLCDMTDIAHPDVPDWMLDKVFAWMAKLHQHTFMVLTKRPERLRDYILRAMYDEDRNYDGWYEQIDEMGISDASPMENIWLGVTVEDQQRADERIPLLLEIPAALRFISYEPALGPISFRWAKWDKWTDDAGKQRTVVNEYDGLRMLDWVVCGAETGPGARPSHPDWFRKVRDDCKEAGVAFFLKHLGEWREASRDELPETRYAANFKDFRLICNKGWGWSTISADAMLVHQPHNYPDHFDSQGEPVCNPMAVRHVGKKVAGRLLDGQEHNEFPTV